MESIPGYDDWKTTPPDDPIYLDINGENLCEVCLNKMYRRIL